MTHKISIAFALLLAATPAFAQDTLNCLDGQRPDVDNCVIPVEIADATNFVPFIAPLIMLSTALSGLGGGNTTSTTSN